MSQLHPNLDLDQANQDLQGKSPEQIVEWALTQAKKSNHHDQLPSV
nr:hypothetical protein [Psychrobacter sp. JCM 18900]